MTPRNGIRPGDLDAIPDGAMPIVYAPRNGTKIIVFKRLRSPKIPIKYRRYTARWNARFWILNISGHYAEDADLYGWMPLLEVPARHNAMEPHHVPYD